MEIEGTILRGRSFDPVEGRIVIQAGQIEAVEAAAVDSDAIILPAFVNAHTHLGDSVAKDAGEGRSLQELVAPPDGLKHQYLETASQEELITAMRRSLAFMHSTGTGAFVEFREGGLAGIRAMEAALTNVKLDPVVLGRETLEAMKASDGYGASGAHDADFSSERTATDAAGKLFGIHAGEDDPADINPALDLNPDFLVHMVHAKPLHLDRVADRGVPVAVCPRSNIVTGVGRPPIDALRERTTVALGTDNVMLNSPSMFREMTFVSKLYEIPAAAVLRMATVNGAELADLDCGLIEPGRAARLLVLDGESNNLAGTHDLRRAVVRRAGVSDVERVVTPENT
jgi:cytosine/adenosine deaminase-related metal-dependent hydrolase